MKTLRMEFSRIEGGCTYGYMLTALLIKNGNPAVKVKRNWKNNKNVFIINDKKYVFSESSHIFNYDGVIVFEEFLGKTRDLSEKCQSIFMSWDKDYSEGYDFSEGGEAGFWESLR